VLRYYITDRKSVGGIEQLESAIEHAIADGVDYIQIREKDLPVRELLALTRTAVAMVQASRTKILVNDRADIALAAGAHGVHLRSQSIDPARYRRLLPLVAVSCHNLRDVAEAQAASFLVFGPIFATPGKGTPVGVDGLVRAVSSSAIPVFALGGILPETVPLCAAAGAAGIAGIRIFQRR
jgi:thiamine-phosphate pyrophosphorylase